MNNDLNRLLQLAEDVIKSRTMFGLDDDLVLVSKESLVLLEDWIVNRFDEE